MRIFRLISINCQYFQLLYGDGSTHFWQCVEYVRAPPSVRHRSKNLVGVWGRTHKIGHAGLLHSPEVNHTDKNEKNNFLSDKFFTINKKIFSLLSGNNFFTLPLRGNLSEEKSSLKSRKYFPDSSQIDKIFPLSWGKFTWGEKQLCFASKVKKNVTSGYMLQNFLKKLRLILKSFLQICI